MPQARRTISIVIGSALCLGSVLIFYAAAHQWFPLVINPSEALGHRPNLALIGLLGVVALAGGISFLARALFPQNLSQRTVSMTLGITLCVVAALALLYMAQGWAGSISRNDDAKYILAWAVLGVVSLVVMVTGARAIYDVTRGSRVTRAPSRSGARHTPQSIF
jgi:uncharacterized membrane protein YidH (DUF202 family)